MDDENSEYVEWRIINYAENNDVAYIAPLGTKAARYFIKNPKFSEITCRSRTLEERDGCCGVQYPKL